MQRFILTPFVIDKSNYSSFILTLRYMQKQMKSMWNNDIFKSLQIQRVDEMLIVGKISDDKKDKK